MFSTGSRYRKVPDVAVPDASGRVLPAKGARPLPEVTGRFTHTVVSGDRLDQLAFTYYGRPLDYWHICDANPSFLSPLDLLGTEPVGTALFSVTKPDSDPPWSTLLAALNGTVGVERVTVEETVTLLREVQTVERATGRRSRGAPPPIRRRDAQQDHRRRAGSGGGLRAGRFHRRTAGENAEGLAGRSSSRRRRNRRPR